VGGVASATLAGFPRRKSLPGVIGTGGRLGFVWIQNALGELMDGAPQADYMRLIGPKKSERPDALN
jgi:hypothetical protein